MITGAQVRDVLPRELGGHLDTGELVKQYLRLW